MTTKVTAMELNAKFVHSFTTQAIEVFPGNPEFLSERSQRSK